MPDKKDYREEQRKKIAAMNKKAKKQSAFEKDAKQQASARKKDRDSASKAAGTSRRSNSTTYRDYRGVDGIVKDAEKGKEKRK